MTDLTADTVLAASNVFDVTALTDAAFERYLDNGCDFEGVVVDDLTALDRRSIAVAYGWDLTATWVHNWIYN